MGSGWKSRKVILAVIALIGIVVGFVYGFMYSDGMIVLVSLASLTVVTAVYQLANAWQARAYAAHEVNPDYEP